MECRLFEHGAHGKSGRLVWFNQTTSREAAKTMEARLQRTLDNDRDGIVRLVDQFDRLISIMRPQKTLLDLQREHEEMEAESRYAFHYIPIRPGGMQKTACGEWVREGGPKWGGNSEAVRRNEEVYQQVFAATGDGKIALKASPYGRRSCQYCLTNTKSPLASQV